MNIAASMQMFLHGVTYVACHVESTGGAILVGKVQLCTMVGVAGKILVIGQTVSIKLMRARFSGAVYGRR